MSKPSPYRYRVNFGNGQVHDCTSKAACFALIAQQDHKAYCCVEWQDPDTGEWFRTGTNSNHE